MICGRTDIHNNSKLYLSGIEIFKQNLVSLIRLHSKLYLSGIEILLSTSSKPLREELQIVP